MATSRLRAALSFAADALPIMGAMYESEEWLLVESLDLEGQGVAHRANGKVVFIEGALPGEAVRVNVARRRARRICRSTFRQQESRDVHPFAGSH